MRILHTLILFLFLIGFQPVQADTVVLKNGTKYEGKITLQTADLIKIEVAITDKIKETKTIGIADVADIIKTAPDDAMFATIQKMVPTGSMVSPEKYREMLKTGPEAFLSSFSGSKHKEKVEEIKKTLEEELDKVERGNFKIEGTWYSPQDRNDYPKLIESKIVLLQMKSNMAGGRYLNLISAMRDFERLEKEYFGTPAFSEATALAQQIIPILGRQVQGLRRDVDVKNAEWEANKNALDLQSRQRVEAAREREEAQFAAAVAADKKARIKWTRVNPRSPENLDSYVQFASTELKRIRDYDVDALKARAEALVAVDKEIAEGKLDVATVTLKTAAAMPTKVEGGTKSRRSSSKKGSSSYSGALSSKLSAKIAERKAIAKAALDAKKSEALTAGLKSQSEQPDLLAATANSTEGTDPEQEGDFDAFAALSNKSPKTEDTKATSKKKSSKKKSSSKPRASTPAVTRPSTGGGGGLPINIIIPALTVLLIVVVVVMKALGIGGKKGKE